MDAVLELTSLAKNYHGLRPLRVGPLRVSAAEHVAIVGLDEPAARTLVDLIVGVTLPDQGAVRLLGQATSAIQEGAEWLKLVDRCGIVGDRAVLLDRLTVVQNLAVPFSLDIEPPSPGLRVQAETLARAVGLDEPLWNRPVGELDGSAVARVRLGRALALDPALILLEHPTSGVAREEVSRFARQVRTAAADRGAATLTLTADRAFARAVAERVFVLDRATGALAAPRRGWFGRL
jgi:ABC-type transporter Mla maintaining outer membrane lipid asymmetry ATPase subunit MlaF